MNTSKALTILRKLAKTKGFVFKKTDLLYNGVATYAFYSKDVFDEQVSDVQAAKSWRDEVLNGCLGYVDFAYTASDLK